MRFRAAGLIAFAAAAVLRAQQPAPPAASATPAPLHEAITVAAETADGRPVAGLRAADFTLTVDGSPQPLDSVERLDAEPRVLALLLDEYHVSAEATAAVREAAHRFVEQQLRPEDRAVILRPLDSLPAIHLTADRDRLHDAINAFTGRKGDYEPRSALEEQTVGRAPALVRAARAQIVLSGLRALASRLGTQPGRAGIILVSEGFIRDARLANARVLPDAGVVERFANRFDVPVFVVDPSGSTEDTPEVRTLTQLADDTGGFFLRSADIAPVLARAGAALDAGYLLRFTPAHGRDGRFHRIDVATARKHVTIRRQAGYVAPPTRTRRALAEALPFTTRLLHRSPFIDVWSGITRFTDAEASIAVTWEPGRGPAGSLQSNAARVSLTATEPDGTVLYQGVLAPVRTTPIAGSNVVNRAEFKAPAGRVYLDMTIFGSRGEKLDVDARDLEVPAAGPTLQLLPPVILAARSAREFREATEDHDAPPDPAREFSRTTRLLIRVAAYGGSGDAAVSARLLNRTGQTLRTLDAIPDGPQGVTQFDLPLAPFAPGEYYLLLRAAGSGQPVERRVPLRVTG
jgi:VWFA-related protein